MTIKHLLTFLLIAAAPAGVLADKAFYSWEGTVLPNDVASDPWMIGSGASFRLKIATDFFAEDTSTLNVSIASFAISEASLWIDGILSDYVADSGEIDFRDISPTADLIRFDGAFSHMGVVSEFSSLVVADDTLFSLESLVSFPPLFGSTVITDESGFVGRFYSTTVPAGQRVTGIPEPSTCLLALATASAFTSRMIPTNRRRCT